MLEAAFWGLIGGASLVLGAALGLALKPRPRTIGLVMGFGSGVLISALSFELVEEAFAAGGADATTAGLALGGLTFFGADWLVDRRGGEHRKRSGAGAARPAGAGAASAIVLGALLDGIPESAAIGITLLGGEGVGVAVVVAVFLSNIPESMSAATGLRAVGHSPRWVLGLWCVVALVSALAAAIGYAALGDADANVVGGIQAFAAGAILVMLADTMMPEAFEHGGKATGLVTLLGFSLAFLVGASG